MRNTKLYIFASAILSLFCLFSCGNLQPLYKTNSRVEKELSNIEIESIDTIQGAEIYYYLTRLIGSGEEQKYLLQIKLLEDVTSPMAITKEARVIKQNVTQVYSYSLTYKQNGALLYKGKFRVKSSYNSVSTPYASYTQEKYTKKNITQTAAEELYLRLIMYFSKYNSL